MQARRSLEYRVREPLGMAESWLGAHVWAASIEAWKYWLVQVACELELWQEAFRSVEDIQGLFLMAKKPAKPQMMAIYYSRLAKIFTVSESHLYNG